MTTFLLIHGAFRTAWSWHLVVERLQRLGHTAVPASLRGMEPGGLASPATETHADVSMDDWVNDVVQAASTVNDDSLVVVGHSMGGVVAQAAAARLGSRVARLVLLDAPLIATGQRAVDVSSPGPVDDALLPPRSTLLPPRPVSAADGFDDALAATVNEHLVATPFGPSLDVVHVAPSPTTRLDLIFCARTPATYPASLTRARCDMDGTPYLLIDAHHDAPLLAPDDVVAALIG